MLTLSRLPILSLSALLLLAFPTLAYSETFYKWLDQNGRVHYSSQKPDDHQDATILNIKEDSQSTRALSHQATESAQSFSTHKDQAVSALPGYKGPGSGTVVMYSTAWCGYCKKARRYFRENNIAFNDYDIEKSAKARSQHKQYGGSGVPLLLFGKHKMRGFNAERFEKLYYQ